MERALESASKRRKQRKKLLQGGGNKTKDTTKPTTTGPETPVDNVYYEGPSDALFPPTDKPTDKPKDKPADKPKDRPVRDFLRKLITPKSPPKATAIPKARPVSEPTTKPLVPGDYGFFPLTTNKINGPQDESFLQDKPVGSSPPTLPTTATPVTSAVEPTFGTPTATTPSKEPTSFFEDLPPSSNPVGVPASIYEGGSQPSSIPADDWSRMTGNFVDKTTGEAMKGPALADVVGGKSKSYDPEVAPHEREARAQQFIKDYPAVDVAGKSSAQVQSERARAGEQYMKNIEGEDRPTRDVAVKRPLSERAPEYRDTKEGREYWVPTDPPPKVVSPGPLGLTGIQKTIQQVKTRGAKFDPQQGGWGRWERNPRKDLDYPDERFRRTTGPIPGDTRNPETRQTQLDLAAQLKTPLANDPNYWLDFSNAEELEVFRKHAKENGVTSRQFDVYIDKVTKKAVYDRDLKAMLGHQARVVRNPANWAMKGLLDPQDVATTRKAMYPDQTAEQAEILRAALDERDKKHEKALEDLKKKYE